MNKQRERLVGLLKETRCEKSCDGFKNIEVCKGCTAYERYAESADYLLANGVIVPPCKVGQTVYQTILLKDKTGFIVERKVAGFHLGDFPDIRGHKRPQYLIVYHDATNSITHIGIDQIGKTVFPTREEAEEALVNYGSSKNDVERKENEGK